MCLAKKPFAPDFVNLAHESYGAKITNAFWSASFGDEENKNFGPGFWSKIFSKVRSNLSEVVGKSLDGGKGQCFEKIAWNSVLSW